MSTMPRTAGTSCASIPSIPCRSVTSAMPQPWHPPPMRSMTTASCTSMSSTRPPSRANAVRMAAPIGFPTACHGVGDCLTTVMRFPDTMSSLTARSGIAKIASASGDPVASSADENRRTPPANTSLLTTNLQRWLSIGSAVTRISAASIPHLARGGHHVLEGRQRLFPAACLEPAVGIHPDLSAVQYPRHALQSAGDLRGRRHARRVDVVHAGADLVGILVLLEALQQL